MLLTPNCWGNNTQQKSDCVLEIYFYFHKYTITQIWSNFGKHLGPLHHRRNYWFY